jgi:alpha-tubulin suppressor-like RCC1 family protein
MKIPALWLCGYNNSGQLGNGTVNSASSPIQTIMGGTDWKQASCGYSFVAAIKTDGTLWTWGRDSYGQLGDNGNLSVSTPSQTAASGTDWEQVSSGQNFVAAVKIDGTLWMWGQDTYGQLGDGNIISQSSPIQTMAGGNNWKQVACGYNHTAAVKTDGTLWTWGYDMYGQLGTGSNISLSSPIQTIAGGTNWNQVSCGGNFTAAIKTDGTMWLWGNNSYGQIGDVSSPTQIIAGGNDWKKVSCGYGHAIATKTDGTLWTWGQNNRGQLGNGIVTPASSPIQTIAGGTNWKSIACGNNHTAAIKADGTLWVWGDDAYGQLGNNARTSQSSPIQTIAGGNSWKSVSCAYGLTAAISECGKW